MRVVYKKTTTDKVNGAIDEARRLGKVIDYIELTELEFRQLDLEHYHSVYRGVRIKKETYDRW